MQEGTQGYVRSKCLAAENGSNLQAVPVLCLLALSFIGFASAWPLGVSTLLGVV